MIALSRFPFRIVPLLAIASMICLMKTEAFAKCKRPQKPAPAGCLIKGNINSKGVRIYHAPGKSRWYTRTCINRPGERWFCSEQEARAAGWRAPRR